MPLLVDVTCAGMNDKDDGRFPIMNPLRVGLFGFFALALGGAGVVAKHTFLPAGETLPGLRVDGREATAPGPIIAQRKAEIEARKVRVVHGDDATRVLFETTLGALGVRVDEEATLARAKKQGHEGDLSARAHAAWAAKKGRIDVPLVLAFDADKVVAQLEALKEKEDTSPESARLDLDKRAVIPEKDGVYLDAWAAAARVENMARGNEDTLVVPAVHVKPRVSTEFVRSLEIGSVMGEYETYFGRGGDQKLRGKNIDNAAAKLDGLVLSPGEIVSFNKVVGERSEQNGFQKSWEIFKGEMVEGVGGGTCQVASTYHAAVLFAGLDILERLPHSRPSAYIPMGLDSTVVYPSVDLKVRNPHPFPVVIHTHTEAGKLRIEVLGKEKLANVSFGREVLETVPYTRKIIEEPYLRGHKVVVKQHGIKGYKVRRSRTLAFVDGHRKTESTTDFYPPTTEIYQVPVGFDMALLPDLPVAADEDAASANANNAAGTANASGPQASNTAKREGTTLVSAAPGASDPEAGNKGNIEFVDAPGAHAPTAAQVKPSKSIVMSH